MTVLDASAVLAFLKGEEGADEVERALLSGSRCSAANYSEVAQKILAHHRDWRSARALLDSYDLEIVPVTRDDAERAAELWRAESEFSLADRLCLALGDRLDAPVLTADRAWGDQRRIRQIR